MDPFKDYDNQGEGFRIAIEDKMLAGLSSYNDSSVLEINPTNFENTIEKARKRKQLKTILFAAAGATFIGMLSLAIVLLNPGGIFGAKDSYSPLEEPVQPFAEIYPNAPAMLVPEVTVSKNDSTLTIIAGETGVAKITTPFEDLQQAGSCKVTEKNDFSLCYGTLEDPFTPKNTLVYLAKTGTQARFFTTVTDFKETTVTGAATAATFKTSALTPTDENPRLALAVVTESDTTVIFVLEAGATVKQAEELAQEMAVL